jgi:putative hydrolase of the HAD superfamily
MLQIKKIVSGGQTGADRAALDFAIDHDIPHGGWISRGRKTEDGRLPDKYRLQEMATVGYAERTEQNVIDSDGTLIISHGSLTGGSAQTRAFAVKHRRPWLHIDLDQYADSSAAADAVVKWLAACSVAVLNVAGSRASLDPELYEGVRNLLEEAMDKDRMVDVVLFDFGGVLADEGWKEGFTAIAEANGLESEQMLQIASDTVYETGYITGKGSEKSFWNAIREKTGIRRDDASLMQEIIPRFILRNWMLDLVRKLKSENLIVGILSDQTDILDKLNAKFDFFKWFDYVFNSYHLGKGKRDITLFDDIAALLKTPPGRILFIDDHPGNVERARQSGWQAILYVDADSFRMELNKFLGTKASIF